jgi:hypothetical protein
MESFVFFDCIIHFGGSLIKCRGKPHVVWPVVMAVLFCVLNVLGEISYITAIGRDVDAVRIWKEILKVPG